MKADEIHVWNGRIAAGEDCFRELYESLSPDETEKATRLRFDKHKQSYVICRGLLRSILAGYLGLRPAEIQIEYGPQGKPFLQNSPVHFSVSHSEDRVLFAFCKNHELGIDLEYMRDLPDAERLARRFFAPSEFLEFCGTSPAIRTEAFFCRWTRKEAYLKATGLGLSLPLDTFQVPAVPGQVANLKITTGRGAPFSGWSLRHLDPAPKYVGALAAPLVSFPLVQWTFENAEACIDCF
ncbi:MAG TPA: 4'-phosphopantetheinyl transferase superfamily protein [Candidatus Sulfotelmatobacter sp.]|nr:4'-phosphopantetheinyl transferase superfamily protein [Candidatus Sulfotelmatobacter sp.]